MSLYPSLKKNLKPHPLAASLILGSTLLSLGFNTFMLRAKADPVPPPTNSYPASEVEAYMNSCVASAQNAGATAEQAEGYCSCTIYNIQDQYTYEEFIGVVEEMQASGEFPPAMIEIINFCQP
jgi:hypothetical protein